MWSFEHETDCAAPPEVVWSVYTEVAAWPQWNDGIGDLSLDGPFAAGTRGLLTPRGQEPLPFILIRADPGEGYVSETAIAETVAMRTSQQLAPRPDGGTRITQVLSLHGPAADVFGASFGPAFAAGVPGTMRKLAERAEALAGAAH